MATLRSKYDGLKIERFDTKNKKKDFGRGAWNAEPDKAHWVDETTGLDCLIVRNHQGALCGYVGVPEEHPLHGKEYTAAEAAGIDAHGSLTYSNRCSGHICHDVGNHVWWLGFDCGHLGDKVPGMDKVRRGPKMRNAMRKQGYKDYPRNFLISDRPDVYRTFKYVKAACADLALQLV